MPPHRPRTRADAPSDAQLTKARAARAFQTGDLRAALSLAVKASASLRRDHELLHLQAACLAKLGDANAALAALEKALRIRPNDTKMLVSLAETYRALQRFGEMDAAIERALAVSPGATDAVYLKAQALRERGRYDDAMAALERALDKSPHDHALRMAHAELCQATGDNDAGADSARLLIEAHGVREEMRRAAHFLLGKLLDAAGRYDEAFDAFERGNEGLGEPRVTTADRVTKRWSAERLASVPAASADAGPTPVLVCGMPRTGTTLVEQMLAAHPKIGTVGECYALPELERLHHPANLTPDAVEDLGRRYRDALARGAPNAEPLVVDKLPNNYLRLGLVSRITPDARVIFCARDPRDTCLSCYTQNFFGDAHPYASDLAACAHQYAEHLAVMDHWRSTLDTPILEVRYADLVREPEQAVRAMLDHLGVDFDEACLRHHESDRAVTTLSSAQVRRPVYRSSLGRWRNYADHLEPLIAALREHGVPLDGD